MAKRNDNKIKRLATASIIFALALGVLLYVFLPTNRTFDSVESFTDAWTKASDDERSEIIHYILNAQPARSTVYSVEATKLHGMTQAEIESILPLRRPDQKWDEGGLSYYLGSIEPDPLGFIVPKQDWLEINFDNDGVIEHIETIN